ncbi:acylphosphatase [Aggregatibacter sp. 2125159857]|uniref:acylphosphatase n=1 Tax=Aggregatibacter sp. 2125159857 TaxID=2820817 RepID=UPI001ADF9ED2|nr:acylphosphatase [Aggregatibacter sp. 2125159857]QTO02257.1 acylphosphatase [Aggregatibacter sp. 2125159857]
MIKKRFRIYGHVQGVGFRYFTWQYALKIGVTGFVRNLADGSVEVIAAGSESQIDALDAWLQHGPRTASVNQVLVEDYLGDNTWTTFQVQHDTI